MAGDWIKMTKDLTQKPEVRRLARALNLSRYDVVGRLHTIWSWADTHSLAGYEMDITEEDIDDISELEGFAAALRQVGWLQGRAAALEFPNFDRHNGQTAKRRASEALRMKNNRTESEQKANKCAHKKRTESEPEKKRDITTNQCAQDSPSSHAEINQSPKDLDEVIRYMTNQLVRPSGDELIKCSCSFYDELSAVGWKNKNGIPLADWRPSARKYCRLWAENNATSKPFSNSSRQSNTASSRNTGTFNEGIKDDGY